MLCVFIAPDVIHQQLMMMMMMMGCGNILELFFLFSELFFFSMVSIGGGDVSRGRGGRPKKKQLEGGWRGGRSASPPDAFAEHAAWFAFSSHDFWSLGFTIFVWGLRFIKFWGLRFIKDLVLCSKTCRFLTEFLGPEVLFFLCLVFIYFWWSQAHKSFGFLGS